MWFFSDEIILDFNFIKPFSIFSKPAIDLNIVVFPIPEGPNRQTISPFFFYIKRNIFNSNNISNFKINVVYFNILFTHSY